MARREPATRQLSFLGADEGPAAPGQAKRKNRKPPGNHGRAHAPDAADEEPPLAAEAEEPPEDAPAAPDAEEEDAAPRASRKNGKKGRGPRSTAETMAARQREISVSEFFTKNRHLLGFDNPGKALLTAVKEAVDNSLDACEEAGILPKIEVVLQQTSEDRYRVIVQDNGPGIVKQQIPKIFGKLLYGSKFHRLKQSRGQQGIGISAAGMYGQLTTGKPVVITSRTSAEKPAFQYEIVLNTRKNVPDILAEREIDWSAEHGTRVEVELEGSYKLGKRSVDEYLEQVAIANPHAAIAYAPPKGRAPVHLPRATDELPPDPAEIKPHPYGVELGMLIKLLKDSPHRTLAAALQHEFNRVTARVAAQICEVAGLPPKTQPKRMLPAEVERLFRAIPKVKILAPPTGCVVPIGEELIRKGLEREIKADLYVSTTRPPAVYRGNPFRVEAGLAYGGALRQQALEDEVGAINLKAEDRGEGPVTLLRFANRVPLQYQQAGCAIFRAAVETAWRQYGLAQPRGGLPLGPMVLLVHIASVWVPFTSESKEAIAHYPEIIKEIKLALRDCGRRLAGFMRSREKDRIQAQRRSIFELYISELARSLARLTESDAQRLQHRLLAMAARHAGAAEEAGLDGEPADEPRAAARRRPRAADEELGGDELEADAEAEGIDDDDGDEGSAEQPGGADDESEAPAAQAAAKPGAPRPAAAPKAGKPRRRGPAAAAQAAAGAAPAKRPAGKGQAAPRKRTPRKGRKP